MKDINNIIFGRNPVLEALKNPGHINKIMFSTGAHGKDIDRIKELTRKSGIPFLWVQKKKLSEMTKGASHQGVLAYVSPVAYSNLDAMLSNVDKRQLFCMLDRVEDPRNLGAVLRAAAAFEVNAVMITERGGALITPWVVKTSAGALRSISVIKIGNAVEVIRKMKRLGFWIIGTDTDNGISLDNFHFPPKTVIIIGNEEKGLRRLVKESCDHVVRIPMTPRVQSLNVSVACGILLYELTRQRKLDNKKVDV